jgi:serine/threonine protein kinase
MTMVVREMSAPEPLQQGFLQRRLFPGIWMSKFGLLIGNSFSLFKDENQSIPQFEYVITPATQIDLIDNEPRLKITFPTGTVEFFKFSCEDDKLRWFLALRGCTVSNPALSMRNFEVVSVLGRGFYGKVILCRHLETGERIAIKTIHKAKLIQAGKVGIVISERNILTKVHHPFIVNLEFAFQTPSKFYLGIEYAPGGELFYQIQQRGELPFEDIRIYMAEICLAIDYLHSEGIVYRDLKPENILLAADGHIKLTDFGLAKELQDSETTGSFCGTSEYVAPEIVRHEQYGFEVDWWTTGILLHELAIGRTPFSHTNRSRLFRNILEKEVVFPPEVDLGVRQFIEMTLTKDPKKRATFRELRDCILFSSLNWDDVIAKRVRPSFHPSCDHAHLVNFDKEFTEEQAIDSNIMPVAGSNERVPDFSYDARPGGLEEFPTEIEGIESL